MTSTRDKAHSHKAALAPAALAHGRRLRHDRAMEILAALLVPALGTGLIIAIVWLVIGRRDAVIADASDARLRLGADWPGFQPAEIFLAADRRLCLALEARALVDGGQIGLVTAFGDRISTRLIGLAELAEVVASGGSLELVTRDPLQPRLSFTPADGVDAATLAARLQPVSARAGAA